MKKQTERVADWFDEMEDALEALVSHVTGGKYPGFKYPTDTNSLSGSHGWLQHDRLRKAGIGQSMEKVHVQTVEGGIPEAGDLPCHLGQKDRG